MSQLDVAITALEAKGCQPHKAGKGFAARCPAHEDGVASLSISHGDGGRVLINCHAGCEKTAIVSALGLTMQDLMPPRSPVKPRIVAIYQYHDEIGRVLYEKVRFEPKSFRLRRSTSQWSLEGVRRVIYRLPQVLVAVKKGEVIWIVEGEKDADRLAALGLCSTTDDAGASKDGMNQKWRPEFSAWFQKASVVVIPDADAPGRARAGHISRELCRMGAAVKVLELPGPGKDASDWLDAGGTRIQLEELARTCRSEAESDEKRGYDRGYRDGYAACRAKALQWAKRLDGRKP